MVCWRYTLVGIWKYTLVGIWKVHPGIYTIVHPGIYTIVHPGIYTSPWVHLPCTSSALGVSVAPMVVSEQHPGLNSEIS